MNLDAGTFAAILGLLYVGHHVGDHWVQTHPQACGKKHPGWVGHLACTRHVTTYTLTLVVALMAGVWMFGLSLDPAATVAGMAVTSITHYLIDRGANLERFCRWVGFGKLDYFNFGRPRTGYSTATGKRHDDNPSLGSGAFGLDQATHILFLAVTAAIITGGAS